MAVAVPAEHDHPAIPRTFTGSARHRKLRVMAGCGAIQNDRMWEGTSNRGDKISYPYTSIQEVSGHLRRLCAEEGLDPEVSLWPDPELYLKMIAGLYEQLGDLIGGERTDNAARPGLIERLAANVPLPGTWMQVSLVNVDDPSDRVVTRWPTAQGDKAWAYSTKYPLVRVFLIGDGAENDEATMADASARQADDLRQAQYRQQAAARQATQPRPAASAPAATTSSAARPAPTGGAPTVGLPGATPPEAWACPRCHGKGKGGTAETPVIGTIFKRRNPDDGKPFFCSHSLGGCRAYLTGPDDVGDQQPASSPTAPAAGTAQPTSNPSSAPPPPPEPPAAGTLPLVTTEQRATLTTLNDALEPPWQVPADSRKDLLRLGFEGAKAELAERATLADLWASLPTDARPVGEELVALVASGTEQTRVMLQGIAEGVAADAARQNQAPQA